jgi:hypothetical protein
MRVDNFDLIREFLEFRDPMDFYHLQIMLRKKDNPEASANNRLIKAYYIKSKEHLNSVRNEIITLCETFNARAYINLGRKDEFRCGMNTLAGLSLRLSKGNIEKLHREYNSQAGQLKPKEAAWIVDIDDVDLPDIEAIRALINKIQPNNIDNKIRLEVPTKSGVHLITSSFNLQEFSKWYPHIDIHKNNPTLLYYNDSKD